MKLAEVEARIAEIAAAVGDGEKVCIVTPISLHTFGGYRRGIEVAYSPPNSAPLLE